MRTRRSFTLIELLVVIAIIALLMSILLPSLGHARRIARTAACAANLHSIAQSMVEYASEWDGAILGNAHTSSAHLFNGAFNALAPGISESANIPGVISANDWLSPTAKVMGLSFNEGGAPADRIARFMQFDAFKPFLCPENDIVATSYTGDGGPNFPIHHLISYDTALCFQYTNDSPQYAVAIPSSFIDLAGFRPKINSVGNPAEKVYIADGGRWWNGSGSYAPDDNAAVLEGSPGGMTSDYGPWSAFSRAYLRGSLTSGGDGRAGAMRHANRKPGSPLASFKFNLAFFDGHVDSMNGLDGADPSLWVPSGARPAVDEYIVDNDFRQRYGPNPAIH